MDKDVQFEPVGNHNTKDVEGEFHSHKLATRLVRGSLGGPHRRDGVEDASAEAVQHASAEHPVGVHGRTLKGGSKNGPDAGHTDSCNSTVAVTEPAADEAADEGSREVVNGDLQT